jgi:SAM-dependent methyltransferase
VACRGEAGRWAGRPAEFLPLQDDKGSCLGVLVLVCREECARELPAAGPSPSAAQLHQDLRSLMHELGIPQLAGQVVGQNPAIDRVRRQIDIAIASDCLEHIKDDVKALDNWFEILNPGGLLYVFVPAFMILWNEHDVANMHFRRYTRKALKKKLKESGFEIIKASYWNFFLFIPILLVRLLSRLLPTSRNRNTGDLEQPPKGNDLLFKLINLENKLLKYLNFPFGVSTFCVARKPVGN